MRDRLLTRHFLQRFLDNDLISPHADRLQTLSLVGAALVSSGLFVTVLLSLAYVGMPFQSPGRTAIRALDDRCLYLGWSMFVMALVAVAAWDGLALDARDTLILGPLPIPRAAIVRAKLKAVVIFATGFVVALNGAPSILHPVLMVVNLPVGMLGAAGLLVIHAVMTSAAGGFGFLSVLGTRELCRALLGPARFNRVSAIVQACLVVILATVLILLPGLSRGVARSWLASSALTPYAFPPLWFLGLHETLAGNLIDRLPRGELPPRILASENQATVLYRSCRVLLQGLGGVALAALGLALLVAVGAYAWNSRRLPVPPVGRRTARSGFRAASAWVAQQLLVRRAAAQAGFFFTLQSLWRSAPHRLSMATCLAVGVAALTVILRGVNIRHPVDVSSSPLGLFAIQCGLIGLVLVGFRHNLRVPAELRANWTFHLAWSGDERPYLAGVKRAALVGLGLPTLIALLPLYAWVLGPRLALLHFASGALIVLLLLEVLLLGFRKLPFVCSYVPDERLKTLAPMYLLAFMLTAYMLASLERLAFSSLRGTATYVAGLATLFLAVRSVDVFQRRRRHVIQFDELPEPATQRLSLSQSE